MEPPSMEVDEGQRSILASRKKYAVFISFSGEDTRNGFTSHLCAALKNAGIDYFIDDDKLERGHEISQALLDAIDDSIFSVVILSENYAASSWCLDELEHIIQCMQQKKTQIVLPVFYHVHPSDVRTQKGTYADAFAEHEQRYNDSMIRRWKAALTTAANLCGWHLSKLKKEADLVTDILNHIRGKLNSTSSKSSDYYLKQGLVGIEKSVADLNKLQSIDNAPILGIWGMGGVGKTTLAYVMFEKFRHQFENHCFLQNVKEEHQKHGSDLVRQFFQRLSKVKNIDLEDLGSIKDRLYHKKLLIVLDDVDNLDVYDSLLKDHHAWLNSESKVIITSRDQQVLRNIIGDDDEKMIYRLDILNEKEALELFYLHAFKGKVVDQNYKELSEKFVDYAQGLPLALKVLGSHLFSKKREVWRSLLSELKEYSDEAILKVLQISFDGLKNIEKSIFLDIACFFRGKKENYVKDVLDACYGSSYDAVIEVLVDKCLISKDDYKKGIILEMHDLLQEMGQSIACGSDDRCLENYSRLWKREDISHVLENNIGTSKIKGIFIDGFGIRGEGEINLDPSVFKKMSSLKLLQLSTQYDQNISFQLPHGLGSFPKELRYLHWYFCPLESLGSILTLRNLAHLSMPRSQLEKLWDGIQDLKNLNYVNLRCSNKLTCLPNLSRANLCHMDLRFCGSLVELPPLRFHNVLDGILYLNKCFNLRIVSEMFGNIKLIDLSWTKIEELHSSIGSLKNLHELRLSYCKHLKKLPSSICYSESLQLLHMRECVSIDKFPELPNNIKDLDLSETSIRQINSSSFECMPYLKYLYMTRCTMLESLPTTICKLKSLEQLCFSNCSQLKSFPEISEPMENLKKLYLAETWIDAVPQPIEYLPELITLDLSGCKNLKSIPVSNIYNMPNISSVYIEEYQRDQDWVVLPDVWISEILQQSKCRCSCSITNLISILKLYGLCGYYKFWKDFTCCECFLLYTIHNILVSKAQQDKIIKIKSGLTEKGSYGPRVSFCYPGNKIPQWFAYKSMGFALHVDFAPSTWNGDKSFLAIVICIVVDFNRCIWNRDESTIVSEIHYSHMDEPDLDLFHRSCLQIQKRTQYNTDHVFICYLTRDDIYYELRNAENASFKFYMEDESYDNCGDKRIKECGIHLLYGEDAEKFDAEKSDAEEFDEEGSDAEEFDTIHAEPHTKRTKI
ncbi:TMV resistance protein N-like [Humulus lupulus]|uniref:TMV resistance protein N-like n=1 Tax=Humulus lupulus TaxID=3486 RepID=UPI002B4091E8|nr:TMV resistance protein N-like [Humulus lupulus]